MTRGAFFGNACNLNDVLLLIINGMIVFIIPFIYIIFISIIKIIIYLFAKAIMIIMITIMNSV